MNPLLILFLIIGAGQLGVSDRYSQCDAGGNHCTTHYKQPDGTYSAIPEKSQPVPRVGESCRPTKHLRNGLECKHGFWNDPHAGDKLPSWLSEGEVVSTAIISTGQQPTCGKGFEWFEGMRECVKWKPVDDNGYLNYICESGKCGGGIKQSALEKAAPAPLKCGQYEHVEHIEGYCHSASCKGNFACPAIAVCDAPVDRCAPDLHTVTEKDWVELMERLKRLEDKALICYEASDGKVYCDSEIHHRLFPNDAHPGPKEGKQ